ncbi:MAG: hypothetical protein KME11_10570 [Timaviella obliquedivisa GSE-PSE-MK23-08B]|nr:hypothetical protein [Timaviella obliquedivisa GSE-PSE-MK23-08B]
MVVSQLLYTSSFLGFLAATLLGSGAQAQTISLPNSDLQISQSPTNQELRPLAQNNNLLSIAGAQGLMQEAKTAVSAQNYPLAIQRLQQSREVLNQLSGFYQELSASFSGIDPRISDAQRQQAIATAQLRDEATYQLALVHRADNKPELSVPLLVQIVRSQNPTRDLGKRAYQQLFELGFVDSPFPRSGDAATPTAPASPAPAPSVPAGGAAAPTPAPR